MVAFPNPLQIYCGRLLKKIRQLRPGKKLSKFSDFVRVEVKIGQLNCDRVQRVFMSVDEGIELCLGPMEWVGQTVPAALNRLDLLDRGLAGRDHQAVDPPLNSQHENFGLDLVGDSNLLLVTIRPGFLQPLVTACARESAVWPHEEPLSTQIAAAQCELDQFAHLDRINCFRARYHSSIFGRGRAGGNRIVRSIGAYGGGNFPDSMPWRSMLSVSGRMAPL